MVNNRSIKLVKRNFKNMYQMTHTPQYYDYGILYIGNLYRDILCYYHYKNLIWNASLLHLQGAEWLSNFTSFNCQKRFIFIPLSINGNHANALLVDQKELHARRIEPHGGVINENPLLDVVLKNIFEARGYRYNNLEVECPYFGIQSASGETFGLCQTAVLYLLGTYIDPDTFIYKYYFDNRLAKEFLLEFSAFILVDMRKRLNTKQRRIFDNYNNQDQITKNSILREFTDSNFYLGL